MARACAGSIGMTTCSPLTDRVRTFVHNDRSEDLNGDGADSRPRCERARDQVADIPTTPERTVAKTLSSGEFRWHVRGTGRRSDRLAAARRRCELTVLLVPLPARSLRASGPVGIADRLHAPSMGVGLSHFRVPADLFGALAVYRTASSRAALPIIAPQRQEAQRVTGQICVHTTALAYARS
jgi:hypothetical protein